jgi:hypothetical protein
VRLQADPSPQPSAAQMHGKHRRVRSDCGGRFLRPEDWWLAETTLGSRQTRRQVLDAQMRGLSDAVDDATHVVDGEATCRSPRRFAAGASSPAPAEGEWKRTSSNMSLQSGARAITTSTVTFSRPMIRSIHSPLNTPGSPQSKPSSARKRTVSSRSSTTRIDVDEAGDADLLSRPLCRTEDALEQGRVPGRLELDDLAVAIAKHIGGVSLLAPDTDVCQNDNPLLI